MKNIHNNIRKLYLIAALEGIVFYYALDKIFMQARGLSLVEMVIIEVIYIIVVVLAEVPSGALSDRWSRKKVLALNSLFFALNTAVWAISGSFLLFAIGVVFGALHVALRSGTDTSLLFDTLKQLGESDKYEKYLGRTRAIGGIAFFAAAIAGGLIGEAYGLEATFWWTLPSAIAAGLVALTLVEPEFHRSTGEVSYWRHIGDTFKFLLKKPRLLHIVGVLMAITVPAMLLDEYGQVYFAFVGVGLIGLGLLGAVTGALDAVFNAVAYWFARIRHNVLFAVSFLIVGVGFILAGFFQSWIGIVLLFSSLVTAYVVSILADADLNRQLSSSIRATSASFFSLATQLCYMPVALAFAWIGERYSIATAFSAIGVVVLVWLVFYCLFSFRIVGRGTKTLED